MIHEKRHFIKCLHRRVGGGGFFCPCCVPSKRSTRAKWYRMAKKAERVSMKRDIIHQLDD